MTAHTAAMHGGRLQTCESLHISVHGSIGTPARNTRQQQCNGHCRRRRAEATGVSDTGRRVTPSHAHKLRECAGLGLERRVVQRPGNAGRQVRWSRRVAHDGNQVNEDDLNGIHALHVCAAAEAIVVVLGCGRGVGLRRLLRAAQLRYEEIGRCPRQEQADNHLNHDMPTECSHLAQGYLSLVDTGKSAGRERADSRPLRSSKIEPYASVEDAPIERCPGIDGPAAVWPL